MMNAAGSNEVMMDAAGPLPMCSADGMGENARYENMISGGLEDLSAKSDRCIVREVFLEVQSKIGRTFTFDACCNNSGDNSMCATFACPDRSFLDTEVAGHTVWLNAPFARIAQFIKHYLMCKQRDPSNTSACILVPAWNHKFRKLLVGMQKVAEYPAGSILFTRPAVNGQRELMGGTPWAVEIWYDPPGQLQTASLQYTHTTQSLTFRYLGQAAGLPASILLDSGASDNFISAAFAAKAQLRVTAPTRAQQVRTAGGDLVPLQGQCTFKLKIQDYSSTITALVMPDMLPHTDLILGDRWLQHEGATLCYQTGTCTLKNGSKTRTLQLGVDGMPATAEQFVHQLVVNLMAAEAPPAVITAKQAMKAIKRGANHFTVLVKKGAPQPDSNPVTLMCAPKCVRLQHAHLAAATAEDTTTQQAAEYPEEIQQIIDEYPDVFAELPPGLPPERDISHTIPLQPGATPPAKRMYRLSPAELEEVKRQVADLLKKGFIEPSNSPYGAPILFVQKKDGSLRMVVDYRALNKITIKNKYPLPRIEDLFDSLLGAKYFSSLDLQSGYHQIRIAPEDVPKTAFRTPIGSYQFKVLCFGLTNSPAVFSKAMYDIFKDYIGKFVCIYLDDILIFSESYEAHKIHLRKTLQLLRDNKLYAKLSKCEFLKPELKFLGNIVGRNGVRMDPAKIAVVKDWPTPKSIKELRSFLGLANYFRRYIQGYSSLVAPLTALLKQDRIAATDWTDEHQRTFEHVKELLTTAPVLTLPDPSKPFTIISDASVNGTGAVLLQNDKVCAYTSKKFTAAEYNYTTTEQELLGIIHALQEWRCYLEGGPESLLITDHHPLVYLQDQPQLSRRQARWLQFLARFNLKWEYRPGRTNVADPISRNPALLAVVTRAETAAQRQASAIPHAQSPGSTSDAPRPQDKDGQQRAACTKQQTAPHRLPAGTSDMQNDLKAMILAGYGTDQYFKDKRHLKQLAKDADGFWLKKGKIVVPNIAVLKQLIMREAHDAQYSGHVGQTRTYENIIRHYWWPGVSGDVNEYVRTCLACQRNKPANQRPGGLLQPLPIPNKPWESISMDLITQLPETAAGHDAIVVFVDRLTKMTHFAAATTNIGSAELADILYDTVIKLHGTPKSIVSDRDPRITSAFWRQLMARLGTTLALSTAYHPQTDGQTERMNRVLEEMLRHYIDPTQTDWDKHLASAEFASNNAYHEGIRTTPFYLNYGHHPRTPLNSPAKSSSAPAAADLAQQIAHNIELARQNLVCAQQRQMRMANKHRQDIHFQVGAKVMLNTKNIRFKAVGSPKLNTKNIRFKAVGSPKLLPRWVGPFTIVAKVADTSYKLKLPDSWRIHNVFHVSLLKLYLRSARNLDADSPQLRFEDGAPVFQIDKVLTHRERKRGAQKCKEYLVSWIDLGPEHNTWEDERKLTAREEGKEALAEYWRREENRKAKRTRHSSS